MVSTTFHDLLEWPLLRILNPNPGRAPADLKGFEAPGDPQTLNEGIYLQLILGYL